MKQSSRIMLTMLVFLSVFFLMDVGLHFVIVPFESLTFSFFNPKGDIDFVNIGFINHVIRAVAFAGLFFFPKKAKLFFSIGSSLIVITTMYLMIDSLWVFWNYLSLYGYWLFTLVLTLWINLALWFPSIKAIIASRYLAIASLISMVIIALVYIDIMGFDWPYEFVYAYVQRIVFEGLFLLIGTQLLKEGYSHS